MTKPEKTFSIIAVFSIVAALGYAIYIYATTGSVPFFGGSGLGGILSGGNQNYAQLQALASNAGFTGDDVNTAAAIALAESSGNPAAVGDLNLTPGGSIGLWQINLKAHPEYTAAQLTDPATNAAAAFSVYQAAGGFGPWSTFNNGAYQAYLPTASGADSSTVASDSSAGGTLQGSTSAMLGSTPDSVGYGDDNDDV